MKTKLFLVVLIFTISTFSPSEDGSRIAFEIAANGSESAEMLTLDVANKRLFPEKIDRCGGSGVEASWLPDGSGFLYNRMKSADVQIK